MYRESGWQQVKRETQKVGTADVENRDGRRRQMRWETLGAGTADAESWDKRWRKLGRQTQDASMGERCETQDARMNSVMLQAEAHINAAK